MSITRLRNVAAATSVLLVIVFFLVQHHPKLPEAYRFRLPIESTNHNNTATVASSLATASEAPSTWPAPTKVNQPNTGPQNLPLQSSPTSHDHTFTPDAPMLVDAPTSSMTASPERHPLSETETAVPEFKPEYTFQNDLDLHLPIERFQALSNNLAHNYFPNGPSSYAYATFMATRNPSLKDPYYMAIHSLIYRILWSPHSRTTRYPFIVFVAEFVTPEQRRLLTGAGAIVRELPALEWNPNVPGIQNRWKDLFAKLNMWSQTDFERILFLDADAFPVSNIDNMFDNAPLQQCINAKLELDDYLSDGTDSCESYVFAGVPQDPMNATDVNINVGSMVFTPSKKMHQRLLQNYVKFDRYNCLMAEQAFLNWQFSINGAFPGTMLERQWGGFFPSEEEEGSLKVVHEKLWSWPDKTSWLKKEWVERWQEMLLYYASPEFEQKRAADGVL